MLTAPYTETGAREGEAFVICPFRCKPRGYHTHGAGEGARDAHCGAMDIYYLAPVREGPEAEALSEIALQRGEPHRLRLIEDYWTRWPPRRQPQTPARPRGHVVVCAECERDVHYRGLTAEDALAIHREDLHNARQPVSGSHIFPPTRPVADKGLAGAIADEWGRAGVTASTLSHRYGLPVDEIRGLLRVGMADREDEDA